MYSKFTLQPLQSSRLAGLLTLTYASTQLTNIVVLTFQVVLAIKQLHAKILLL